MDIPAGRNGIGGGPPDLPEVLGDTVLQSMALESLSSAVNFNRWLTDLALPYLGEHPIELGSGLGDYAQTWLDAGVPEITTSEIDPVRLARLQSRFAAHSRAHVASFDVLAAEPADHSAFVAFNVLEHIPDHVGALAGARRLVRPGGAVIIFVPAFEFALGRFDRLVGHVRRYTRKSLGDAMVAAGLEVEKVDYVNMPGLPAWLVGMKMLRMTPRAGPLLSVWDGGVIPLARRWESRHRVPFGQSVFAVARVRA